MMGRSIRARMALASVLPVLLVVLTTASIFWRDRVRDLEASHQQRLGLLVHQVALFSTYGLFSGNTASLQGVVQAMQREAGVEAVLVFDAAGNVVASSGKSGLQHFAELETRNYIAQQRDRGIDVQAEPVRSAELPIEDLLSLESLAQVQVPRPLGSALIELSRHDLEEREREALLTAIAVGAVGIMLGGLLAFRLGSRVMQPMVRMSQMVQRIGRGNFAPGEVTATDDPMHELQTALNQMAGRLAWSREDLERQVQTVTHELRLKKDQAESATLAKSRFLAAASHDLRQPSHALGMFVARLGQLPMDAQMRQLVDNLEISVQSMQDLLDSLLDLSQLDAGHVQVRLAPVDLNALLDAVRNTLETVAEAKGLRLHIRPTRLWAQSDALLLQRMLLNLVVNAIRYTEQGSVLVVCRPHAQGRGVRIEVWDSGIGIAPAHHEDIFKEFYQLANQAGYRNFGLGLGLNIVQRSAALLDHRITLRSSPGCGTRFSIVLQAARQAPGATPHATLQPVPGDIRGLQVLLIEDNANVRAAVQGLLQAWGCRVQSAASRAEALQSAQTHGMPDVILSDYHLGTSETGIECIAALRSQAGRPVPACLMSGETDEDFQQAVRAANLPLLHKPVRPAKLRSLLRHLKT